MLVVTDGSRGQPPQVLKMIHPFPDMLVPGRRRGWIGWIRGRSHPMYQLRKKPDTIKLRADPELGKKRFGGGSRTVNGGEILLGEEAENRQLLQ